MDGQRFDDLVRGLATGATRRAALKAAAGGALAAVLGFGAAAAPAAAAEKNLGQKCDSKQQCGANQFCKQTSVGGSKRCCRRNGDGCNGSRDCCGRNSSCNSGSCAVL